MATEKDKKKNRMKVHVHSLVMDQNKPECQGDGICSHTGLCTEKMFYDLRYPVLFLNLNPKKKEAAHV